MTDISNDPSVSGGMPIIPMQSVQETEGPSTSQDMSGTSTIAKSDKEAIEKLFASGLPLLMPPNFNGSFPDYFMFNEEVSTISTSYLDVEHAVKQSILDSWNESIEKIEERKREELNSPQYRAMLERQVQLPHGDFQQWIAALGPVQKTEITSNYNIGIRSGITNAISRGLESASRSSTGEAAPAIAVTALLGLLLIPTIGAVPISSLSVGINPVAQALTQAVTLIPANFQAELGFLGALLVSGMTQVAMLKTMSKAKGNGAPIKTFDMAKSYANEVASLVKSMQGESFIRGFIIGKMGGGEALSDAKMNELVAIVKLVLLASSLGALYGTEAGKMTEEEFGDMIRGNMAPRSDIEKGLVSEFQVQLAILSPNERARIIEGLMEYYASEPPIEELFEPKKVFDGVLSTTPYDPNRNGKG